MKLVEYPRPIRPYVFHGTNIDYDKHNDKSKGTCFECFNDALFVNHSTGQFRCYACGQSGNVYTYLNTIWETLNKSIVDDYNQGIETPMDILKALKGISHETQQSFGVAYHKTGTLSFPVFNREQKLVNLCKISIEDAKWKIHSTPGCKTWPFGLQQLPPNNDYEVLYIVEGLWDTMNLYEFFINYPPNWSWAILGVPGVSNYSREWNQFLAPRNVIIFDNDHPRRNGQQPALQGAIRTKRIIQDQENPPTVNIFKWSDEYHDITLPDGYDISDLILDHDPDYVVERILKMPKAKQAPGKTAKARAAHKRTKIMDDITPATVTDFQSLIKIYREALHVNDAYEKSLAVVIATLISTELPGENLFLRLISPPGSGKTTMVESFSSERAYVHPVSQLTGLHSGFIDPHAKEEEQDNSIIKRANGKTLIVKDADTLASHPNKNQILSELRDIYDGTSRAEYRNTVSHHYEHIQMTLILCGTDALRDLNRAALGDRWLDCDLIGTDDVKPLVDRAADNAYLKVLSGLNVTEEDIVQSSGILENFRDVKAGSIGYLRYLKENMMELPVPRLTREQLDWIKTCGELLSLMRAQVKREKEEIVSRPRADLATRSSSQLTKLAVCVALATNKQELDAEVESIISKVVQDTAASIQFDICKFLYEAGDKGQTIMDISDKIHMGETSVRNRLHDLRMYGMVQHGHRNNRSGNRGRAQQIWKLKQHAQELIGAVLLDQK